MFVIVASSAKSDIESKECVCLTKVDKIGRTLREKQLQLIKDTLNIKEEDKYILFSSTTKLGKNDVTSIIDKIVYPNED